MKQLIVILLTGLFLNACHEPYVEDSINPINWADITFNSPLPDSMETGSSYLSIYSQIYSLTEHRKHNLTATISMRNMHRTDTFFILAADYYNTKGELIRSYIKKPIFLSPMETVEIVIDEIDQEGGTGGNFLFDWMIKPESIEPLFEGVMISTSGTQGLSFTTQGIRTH